MPTNPNAPYILLAFANPNIGRYSELRRLPDEASELRDLFLAADHAGLCQLIPPLENAILKKVFDAFNDRHFFGRIAVFHFAGHADSHTLLLETAQREALLADASGFANFLAEQKGLKLVFLNACSTQKQVQGLLDAGVEVVVATTKAVHDDWALPFAVRFYTALVGGATISSAFGQAEAEARTVYGKEAEGLWCIDAKSDEAKEWKLVDAAIQARDENVAAQLIAFPLVTLSALLRERYLNPNFTMIERVSSPPLPIEDCFVNVAIVREQSAVEQVELDPKSKQNNRQYYDRQSAFSTFETIYQPKESIAIEDLFKADKGKIKTSDGVPRRLLMLGRAGIGKSTFCQKIANLWARGELWKDKFDLIFWIRLRNINTVRYDDSTSKLGDEELARRIIEAESFGSGNIRHIDASIFKNERALFLLDGYDETSWLDNQGEKAAYLQSALQTLIRNAPNLILTTRPTNTTRIVRDLTLEITGFRYTDIGDYSKLYFEHAESVAPPEAEQYTTGFLSYLRRNQNVYGLAHIPVLLDLLCSYWLKYADTQGSLTENLSMTELYYGLVALLVDRYRTNTMKVLRSQLTDPLETDSAEEKLETKINGLITIVRRLAFEGLQTGRLLLDATFIEQILRKAGVKRSVSGIVNDLIALGFVKKVGDAPASGDSIYFLHLTLQEFFTAGYLVELRDQNQAEFENNLQTFKLQPQFEILLTFLSGQLSILSSDPDDRPVLQLFAILEGSPHDVFESYELQLLVRCFDECNEQDRVALESRHALPQRVAEAIQAEVPRKFWPLLSVLNATVHLRRSIVVRKPLITAIEGNDTDAARRATFALGYLGHTTETITKLTAILTDTALDADFRAASAIVLGQLGDTSSAVLKALGTFLNETDIEASIRSNALVAINRLGVANETITEALVQYFCSLHSTESGSSTSYPISVENLFTHQRITSPSVAAALLRSILKVDAWLYSEIADFFGMASKVAEPVIQNAWLEFAADSRYNDSARARTILCISVYATEFYSIAKADIIKIEDFSELRQITVQNGMQFIMTVDPSKQSPGFINSMTHGCAQDHEGLAPAYAGGDASNASLNAALIKIISDQTLPLLVRWAAIMRLGHWGVSNIDILNAAISVLEDQQFDLVKGYSTIARQFAHLHIKKVGEITPKLGNRLIQFVCNNDEDIKLRMRVGNTLANHGVGGSWIDSLLELAQGNKQNIKLRVAVLDTISPCKFLLDDAAETLLRLATDIQEDLHLRTVAITTLMRLEENTTELKGRLISALFKERPLPELLLAYAQASDAQDDTTISALLKLAVDGSASVTHRCQAMLAIGKASQSRPDIWNNLEDLIILLSDVTVAAEIRIQVAYVLRAHPNPINRVLMDLIEIVANPKTQVALRVEAARTLVVLGYLDRLGTSEYQVANILKRFMIDTNIELKLRQQVVGAPNDVGIGGLPRGSHNPALIDAMFGIVTDRRRKRDIRREAAIALGNMGVKEPRIVEALSSFLQEPATDDEHRDIAKALLELNVSNDMVRNALVSFLSSVKRQKRENGNSSIILLSPTFKDYIPENRSAVEALLEVVGNPSVYMEVRVQALETLAEVGVADSDVSEQLMNVFTRPRMAPTVEHKEFERRWGFLPDPEREIKEAILKVLGKSGIRSPEIIAGLIEQSDQDWAAELLYKLGIGDEYIAQFAAMTERKLVKLLPAVSLESLIRKHLQGTADLTTVIVVKSLFDRTPMWRDDKQRIWFLSDRKTVTLTLPDGFDANSFFDNLRHRRAWGYKIIDTEYRN